MSAFHEHTLRTPCVPPHVQIASDGIHLGLPYGRNNVGVWSLHDITGKPLELIGHSKPVSALCFNKRPPSLLCSCGNDYIIVWHIERCKAALSTGQQVRGQVVGQTLGSVRYCSFNVDDTMVAVCIDREVLVLDATKQQLRHTLHGHTSAVNCAEFCPHYAATLVTASDDRTFKVWDLTSSTLLYQSCIISSSPFITIAMNPLYQSFALGTTDGQIREYDLTDRNGFRCLHHIDVEKILPKLKEASSISRRDSPAEKSGPITISSRPLWKRPDATQLTARSEEPIEANAESEAGCSIISMVYTHNHGGVKTPLPCTLPFLQDDALVSELLENAPMMAVVTTAAILQLNARTFEFCSYTNLQDPLPSHSMLEEKPMTVSLVGSAVLAQSLDSPDLTWCALGNLFGNEVSVLRLGHPTYANQNLLKLQLVTLRTKNMVDPMSPESSSAICNSSAGNEQTGQESDEDGEAESQEESEPVTVLSSAPLVGNSPLKAELVLKTELKLPKKRYSKGRAVIHSAMLTSRRASTSSDEPLVFHEKIKSSGYSATSKLSLFSPKINRVKHALGQTMNKSKSTPDISDRVKEYPTTGDPPTQVAIKLDVADRPTAINGVHFSSDGQQLLCALANRTAQLFNMPLTGRGASLTGHNGVVTSAQWSQDNKWVITSSDDRTASIWSLSLPDPVMTVATSRDNFGANKEGGLKPAKENPAFTKPVKYCQFYYMDKFFLLACGGSFSLYKFHLDTTKSDIKRYLSNNRYKLVSSWSLEHSQQITAFSAVNSFYSYLALCGGSNRAVEVFDLNVGKNVRTIHDVHTRAPHVINQNEGSTFVSHSANSYDLFVTAASADCIKLWDLRSNRCVRRYEGHMNRVHPCGVSISPCSRFIATGSEDRSAYIFDIRSGTYLHKLMGHTDTVGQVAFHPLYPELLTASMDGKLRLYKT